MLSDQQLQQYRACGHLTVSNIFDEQPVADALADIDAWSREFLSQLSPERRQWYLERADATGSVLRKLDEPVFHREIFRKMATSPSLVAIVQQLIGSGISVFYSQVFCKPPEIGGPKPVHQDNFYFGPNDCDATLTAWIALDDATIENGCLFYADGSQRGPVYPHVAPANEPFNLQITEDRLGEYSMSPAPVSAGGVSLHHGNTWHQSSSNTSHRPRRAVAIHYLRNGASLVAPALNYNASVVVRIT